MHTWEYYTDIGEGKRGDVQVPVGDSTKWGRSYLCVFKRRAS